MPQGTWEGEGAFVAVSLRGRLAAVLGIGTGEVIHRRLDASALVRHAGQRQAHLDAAERAGQHEVVEIAQVADAEDLVLHLAETGAEREVEALQDDGAQGIGAVPLGHQHGG